MTEEEWRDRYAKRIAEQAGWPEKSARKFAKDALPFTELSEGYEDDPEGAADMEMSYWSD